MPQPIPYLAFNGSCAEAMRFYAHALHGMLGIITNRNTPFARIAAHPTIWTASRTPGFSSPTAHLSTLAIAHPACPTKASMASR